MRWDKSTSDLLLGSSEEEEMPLSQLSQRSETIRQSQRAAPAAGSRALEPGAGDADDAAGDAAGADETDNADEGENAGDTDEIAEDVPDDNDILDGDTDLLKELLKDAGLPVSGSKAVLVWRLRFNYKYTTDAPPHGATQADRRRHTTKPPGHRSYPVSPWIITCGASPHPRVVPTHLS